MKTIILSIFLTVSANAGNFGTVLSQLKKRAPNLPKYEQIMLAHTITKICNQHKINPRLFTAILIQESGLKLDAINKKSNDYGISQINKHTIARYKFNKQKLLTDVHYSISAGVLVLADFKKSYGKRDKFYWTRYNTSNPEKREVYKKLVMRHW
jgi:soluble lytic murein transglycosylase-like protein